jgi:heterotetrameric sarcosine oxidase gamma subunit
MAKSILPQRVSALNGHLEVGIFGVNREPQIHLAEEVNISLHQVTCWPDTKVEVGTKIAVTIGAPYAPGPRQAVTGTKASALQIEPLKFWILDAVPPTLSPDMGSHLDLSQSRTCIDVRGKKVTTLLNQYLPLDMRDASFPEQAVASTAFHHVGITLWRTENTFKLFVPRSFARSLWALLWESALQYGVKVT